MIYRLQLSTAGHRQYNHSERFAEIIVNASSETEARELAAQFDKVGGESIWKSDTFSWCKELDINQKIISYLFIPNQHL